jgi:hypothetical protein
VEWEDAWRVTGNDVAGAQQFSSAASFAAPLTDR